jgi:pyridoxine 5-phosphate synthase
MVRLGVNIDHVATLRNARGGVEPEPLTAAALAELGGADGITIHLREDRRHIRDSDVELLRKVCRLPLNLEMACSDDIVKIARNTLPYMCTLVPERREELTTEGGLDVGGNFNLVKRTVSALMDKGIKVSLFVDPDLAQIEHAINTGAEYIELHTGTYALAQDDIRKQELAKLYTAAAFAQDAGLIVNAGHGLNYQNTADVAMIAGLYEVNIGHSIVSRAVFVGLQQAVADMKQILLRANR